MSTLVISSLVVYWGIAPKMTLNLVLNWNEITQRRLRKRTICEPKQWKLFPSQRHFWASDVFNGLAYGRGKTTNSWNARFVFGKIYKKNRSDAVLDWEERKVFLSTPPFNHSGRRSGNGGCSLTSCDRKPQKCSLELGKGKEIDEKVVTRINQKILSRLARY